MNIYEVLPCTQTSTNCLLQLIPEQSVHLSNLQIDSIGVNAFIIFLYVALLLSKATLARKKVFAAALIGLIVCYLPVSWLTNFQYYMVFSLVYLTAASAVTNKKVRYSCVIMALFQFIMATDRKFNSGIETWTYQNYEVITCLIHILIVCSFVKWGELRIMDRLGKLLNRVRSWLLDSRIMAAM